MAVTIVDIARRAGVSHPVVSKVLNGAGGTTSASEETRRKILAIADEMGYRPNLQAKSLRGGKTRTIGLLARTLNFEIDVIEKQFRQAGYSLLTASSKDSGKGKGDAYEDVLRDLLQRGIDGLLFIKDVGGSKPMEILRDSGVAVVLAGVHVEFPDVDTFCIDNQAGVELLVEHFQQLGHKRIAAVFMNDGVSPAAVSRDRGWRNACRKGGVEVDESWFIQLGLSAKEAYSCVYQRGYEAGKEFMRRFAKDDPARPTAIYASVDEVAVGICEAMLDAGWDVPGDISIGGMQNLVVGRFRRPAITTVELFHLQSFRDAADRLLEKVSDPSSQSGKPVIKTYEPKLICRQSSGPAPF